MKPSSYNVNVPIDERTFILYNSISNDFVVCDLSIEGFIKNLDKNLNKETYSPEEVLCISTLIEKGIILKDDITELNVLKFAYDKERFDNKDLNIYLKTNSTCNFKCSHCLSNPNNSSERISTSSKANIISFIKNEAKKYSSLNMTIYGGEPILELDSTKNIIHEINNFCKEKAMPLSLSILSNGFLINDSVISKFITLNIKKAFIYPPAGGMEESNNKTCKDLKTIYETITQNIINALDNNINLVINPKITDFNYDLITELFDNIPLTHRSSIDVSLNYIEKASYMKDQFSMYKHLIDMGYKITTSNNKLVHCYTPPNNNFFIEPDGRVVPCYLSGFAGEYYGYIDNNGELVVCNQSIFYNMKNNPLIKKDRCKECASLPFHSGSCLFETKDYTKYCPNRINESLSLKERVLLHYYNEKKHNKTFNHQLLRFKG